MLEEHKKDPFGEIAEQKKSIQADQSTPQKLEETTRSIDAQHLLQPLLGKIQNLDYLSNLEDDPKAKKSVQNQKAYQKQKGIYEPTKLEQAKLFLKKNNLDMALLKQQQLWMDLESIDQEKVKRFLKDQMLKINKKKALPPKSPEQKLQITKEQLNTINNIQVNRNEAISKAIFEAEGLENLKAVMWRLNNQNHIAILEFLKSLENVPFDGFLQVLMQIIDECEDHTQQIRLLVGLCGIYSGQELVPTVDLCCSTLSYLANKDGVATVQVIGFLKFTFVTQGDIHSAELSDLKEFDRRHMQCFHAFKQWLQRTFKLPPDLILVLPNSCYILGKPFAKRLKDGGLTLTEHIPSDFLQLFIQILTFSFERDKTEFKAFLHAAQQGFLELFEKINTTQLLNLFSSLFNVITEHNNQWYRNMRNSRALIEGALGLVKESKIESFSPDICQNLLSGVSNIDEYLNRPSLIKKETNQDNDWKLKQLIQINQNNYRGLKFLKMFDAAQKLPANIVTTFTALKIIPHFIQELAMKIQLQNTDNPRLFLNIAPGQGKTKLIVASAINLVQTKSPVLILNTNKTLLNRDFQEAVPILGSLNISCATALSHNAKITFITVDEFIQLRAQLPPSYHTILDEHHNVFFNKKLLFEILELLQQSITFTGFSGSPLNFLQKKLLHQCFTDQVLVLQLTPPNKLESEEAIVCKSQRDQVKELVQIAKKYQPLVPQVFILDEATAAALMKGKAKQPYISLINADVTLVNNTLSQLFNKSRDDKQFGTYIINEEMGTGTDFKTSADIENNGGLFLVFGIKPTSISTFEQLSYRVGRIFQKGRRAYIINDAQYNGSSKDYLKFQLSILKQKEMDEARNLLNDLKKARNIDSESDIQSLDISESGEDNDDNGELMMEDCSQLSNKENQQKQLLTGNKANVKEECKYCENDHEEGQVCKAAIGKSQLATATKDVNTPQVNQQQSPANEHAAQQTQQIIQKIAQNSTTEEDEKHKDSLNVEMIEEVDANSAQQKHIPQVLSQIKQKDLLKKRSATTDTSQLEKQIKKKKAKVSTNKSVQNIDKLITQQQQKDQDNAYVRVENAFKVIIPKNELQQFKEQHLNNREDVLTQNQQQQQEFIKVQQQSSASIKGQEVIEEQKDEDSSKKEMIDQSYFAGYSNIAIHKVMLKDKVRVKQYTEAINLTCKDKIVLDLGCGSGILSVLAIQAEAKHVYAVDAADIKDIMSPQFQQFIDEGKITFIKGTIEKLALENPHQIPPVDVVLSEWMGYLLIHENMLSSYLIALKVFLKSNGDAVPKRASIYLDLASYDLTNATIAKKYLKNDHCKIVLIKQCKPEYIISNDHTSIKEFDFNDKDLQNPLDGKGFACNFNIHVGKAGTFNALVGSFDTLLCDGVSLNTMPSQPVTHWMQSIFFINNPIEVQIGDIIEGEIKISADEQNYRNQIIKITYKVNGKEGSTNEEIFTFE